MNNFNSSTEDLKNIHFADGITLYVIGKSLTGLVTKIIAELHKHVKWFQVGGLFLNNSKSFITVFSNSLQAHLLF